MAKSDKEDASYYKAEGSVEETDDGGAIVSLDTSPPQGSSKFYANLAEGMDEPELALIGGSLWDLIDKDKKARERRDEQYEEGIRRTGLGDDAPGGAQFMGASKVVHPMLTESCVDFSSRVMKELFPANGPAKSYIAGEPTKKDVERSERITDYLNYQCIVQIPEMRSELEQMSTQLPLGGGQYVKLRWSDRYKRPSVTFVSIDDIYLPYAATNFYTSERKTHVQYVTRLEFQQRIQSGMYRDIETISDPMPPEMSKSEQASDKIEGRELDSYNEDGLRAIYECFCMYDLKGDDDDKGAEVCPYIISIDASTKRVLSIYRNWDEEDEKKEELEWLVEFAFLPWRGAYPIGLTHLIGGLSAAATGALRALLDSAHINNFPGLLKLKGGAGGQTERPDPTQVMEIEGSIQDDDVRKLIMPMPFNPPSPVLFELLGFLQESGRMVVRTTMQENPDEGGQNTPVGTTMARLEQGMMVFSAIHARMHESMKRLLKVLYRINKFYLEEDQLMDETGKVIARRSDFMGPMTVIPVSDPNIFSESQRFAQIQLIAQRAQMLPQLYNLRKVEEMILDRMKIPDTDELLLPAQEGKEMNAVNENLVASMGRPVVAFPDQDHMSHIETHVDFMSSQHLGMNPLIAQQAMPVLVNHIKEHMALWYVTSIVDLASEAAEVDITELQKKATTEEKQKFDQMLALASKQVVPKVGEQFAKYMPALEQAQQMLQQIQQSQMPQDPTMQLGMAKIQSDEKMKQMEIQAEMQKIQLESQMAQQIEQLKAQVKQAEVQSKGQFDMQKAQMEAMTDQAKMAQEARQADQVISIEYMKQQAETQRLVMDLQNQITLLQMELSAKAQIETSKMEMQGSLEHEKLQSAHMLEDKKMSHASQLEDQKAQSAMSMEGMKQESAHALEDKRLSSAQNLEGMKQQSAHALEDKKQTGAQAIEDKKQGGARMLEQQKAAGGLITTQLTHENTMEAERERMAHEEKQQKRTDTIDLYKHHTQLSSDQESQDKEHKQQSKLEKQKAEVEKTSQEKDHQQETKVEKQKAEHDMAKTKVVEKNKVQVADKQLKLKEKEGKEQLKIKQEESKEKIALKRDEHGMKMQFKEAEGKLGLQAKAEKVKLEGAYSKEEHKSKMDLLKTKTQLTEAQLKEKAKIKSAEMKQKKPKKEK